MQIPFKSLRFNPGASQIWGLQLVRNIGWKNERTFLNPVPISSGSGEFRVSTAGTLTGIEVPAGNRTFEIKPYAIGSLATDVNTVPRISNEGDGNFGFDVKYGVTQNLTADFTYNTDFAQVEVDEQQVNLTRFSLFFPEKRECFLEGRGIFDFGVGARFSGGGGGGGGGTRRQGGGGFSGGGDVPTMFFSRRIGLESGQTVPILGGGRLTGKAGKFSIGAVNIQTDDAPSVGLASTNFTVLRVKRDILRRSRIGGIFTGRSVSTTGRGSNEVYGVDAAFAFYDNVNFNGYYARTKTPGLTGDDASYQGVFTYKATAMRSSSTTCSSVTTSIQRSASCGATISGAPLPRPKTARGPARFARCDSSQLAVASTHRERGRSGRNPDCTVAFQHLIREQRSVWHRCPGQ